MLGLRGPAVNLITEVLYIRLDNGRVPSQYKSIIAAARHLGDGIVATTEKLKADPLCLQGDYELNILSFDYKKFGFDPYIDKHTRELAMNLAKLVFSLWDGTQCEVAKESIARSFGGKDGTIRKTNLAKRVDWNSRHVVRPSTHMEFYEISLPLAVLRKQTYPTYVSNSNIDMCRRLVMNGNDCYPGASMVVNILRGQVFDLRHVDRYAFARDILAVGMVVRRHLQHGDLALVNRPPTLTSNNLNLHQIRVGSGSSAEMHPFIMAAYDMDCDGDHESNFYPQSDDAAIELEYTTKMNENSTNHGTLALHTFPIEAGLLGLFNLAQRCSYLCDSSFANCLTAPQSKGDTVAAIYYNHRRSSTVTWERWYTGSQLLSASLPHSFFYDDRCVAREPSCVTHVQQLGNKYRQFRCERRDLVKKWLFRSETIKHTLVIGGNIVLAGSSVWSPKCGSMMHALAHGTSGIAFSKVMKMQADNVHKFNNQQAYSFDMSLMDTHTDSSELHNMIASGSCCDVDKLETMRLGRLASDGTHVSSLKHGLSFAEMKDTFEATRESMVYSADFTKKDGHVQRRLEKSLQNSIIQYDMSVRNTRGDIIQLLCGEHGFAPEHLFPHRLACHPLHQAEEDSNRMLHQLWSNECLHATCDSSSSYIATLSQNDLSQLLDAEKIHLAHLLEILHKKQLYSVQNQISRCIMIPIRLTSIIDRVLALASKQLDTLVVSAGYVIRATHALVERIYSYFPYQHSRYFEFECCIYQELSIMNACVVYKFTTCQFNEVLVRIINDTVAALSIPGDALGSKVAQCLASISTRASLCRSSSQRSHTGEHLSDLIHPTDDSKLHTMKIYLRPLADLIEYQYVDESELSSIKAMSDTSLVKGDRLPHALASYVSNELVEIYLYSIKHCHACMPNYISHSLLENEALNGVINNNTPLENITETNGAHMIQYELHGPVIALYSEHKRQSLCEKVSAHLDALHERYAVHQACGKCSNKVTYHTRASSVHILTRDMHSRITHAVSMSESTSDDASTEKRYYLRIYLDTRRVKLRLIAGMKSHDQVSTKQMLEIFAHEHLDNILIAGVRNIVSARVKSTSVTHSAVSSMERMFFVETVGSNLRDVIAHPFVDANTSTTSNAHEMEAAFGIVTATECISRRLDLLFNDKLSHTTYNRYLSQHMSRDGRIRSLLNKVPDCVRDGSFLCAQTAQPPVPVIFNAAMRGETDRLVGSVESILASRLAPVGTGFVTVVLENCPPQPRTHSQDVGRAPRKFMRMSDNDVHEIMGSEHLMHPLASDQTISTNAMKESVYRDRCTAYRKACRGWKIDEDTRQELIRVRIESCVENMTVVRTRLGSKRQRHA